MKLAITQAKAPSSAGRWQLLRSELKQKKILYWMSALIILYYILFHYVPMYGVIIAFKDYKIIKGIAGSPWVGLANFINFFKSYYFSRIVGNTIIISLMQLVFGFPMPILFALLLNEVRSRGFKRTIQTVSYLPHFISTVVVCGMIVDFFARDGIITSLLVHLGMDARNMLTVPEYFRFIYVSTDIWQSLGWSSIIYIAALSGVEKEQYEAATVDGAGRFRQIWHVSLPGIAPTVLTLLILNCGRIMSVGFEKILLLYNANTYKTADVISTYVYRYGLSGSFQFSYTTAIGLFSSIVNVIFLTSANFISRKVNQTSLW